MVTTVDPEEIQAFSKDSTSWWDENGPFKPLHRLNPVRLSFIKQQICDHYGCDMKALDAFKGLKILDIGCGGGLVCEPLARLGATVTGADADTQAISVAKEHAQNQGLDITYLADAAEDIEKCYDVVLALEIIEHVTNPHDFISTLKQRVRPGGLVIVSTLNRNPKSFLFGIIAAEYLLRWVPAGTHNWKKFIKPSELSKLLRAHKLYPHEIAGIMFDPFGAEFRLSETDIDVNYIMSVKA